MELTGSCFCNKVQYQISKPLRAARSCHCSKCRKTFSGAGSAYAEIEPGSLQWIQGRADLTYFESIPGFGLMFCRTCGSTLCGVVGKEVHGVTLGTLDGDPGIELENHIFVGSKAPWDHIGGAIPQFYGHVTTVPNETTRLRFRQLQLDDLEDLYALDSDPEVMKYIHPVSDKETALKSLHYFLSLYDELEGMGFWAAIDKQSKKFIGWFCLKPLADRDEIELGYRLNRSFWNQGYATEGSKSVLEYAFQKLELPKVVGITHPENKASKRVLEKVGFEAKGNITYTNPRVNFEGEVSYFELDKLK